MIQTVDCLTQDTYIKSEDEKNLNHMSVESSWTEKLLKGVKEYCVHR